MSNRALYFPYIRLPPSTWLSQTLLYWDQVSSIVPYEFLDKPDELGPFMQQLVHHGLVEQIQPAGYLHEIPRFTEAFSRYLHELGPELRFRQERFREGSRARIHIEKIQGVSSLLEDVGLAKRSHYPWFSVEEDTADDFMYYLATALGQLPTIDSLPVTDTDRPMSRLLGDGSSATQSHLQAFRLQVLDGMLPVPLDQLQPNDIRRFKDKYGAALSNFRRRVERELITLATITDDTLRARELELFLDEATERTREIINWMTKASWRNKLASIGGIVAAIPGAHWGVGLLSAVAEALSRKKDPPSQEFAYAAYVEMKLGQSRGIDDGPDVTQTRVADTN